MSDSDKAAILRDIANNGVLMVTAHRKIENALIDFRDRRISLPGRGNGLVVREAAGAESGVIRMGVQDAIRMALRAIADELDEGETES